METEQECSNDFHAGVDNVQEAGNDPLSRNIEQPDPGNPTTGKDDRTVGPTPIIPSGLDVPPIVRDAQDDPDLEKATVPQGRTKQSTAEQGKACQ